MRRLLSILAVSLLAVLPASGAITGIVMTSEGQPIAGAKVETFALETLDSARTRLLGPTPERVTLTSAQTDAKGRFTLESPKEAVVQFRVTAAGYAPNAQRIERDEDVGAVVLAAAEMKNGRITASGKPVAGAKVIWSGAGEVIAATDAEGRYRVPDPAKWASSVTVIHPDYAILDELVSRGLEAPKTSPDRTLAAGTALTGTVVAEDGKSVVAGAIVTIEGWAIAKSDENGTFSIAHAPAKWQMVYARSGSLIGSRARAGNPSSVVVKLGKAATLIGTVRDTKTLAPIAGADVRLRFQMRFEASEPAASFTDAKGTFTFTVSPGAYQMFVTRPGYAFTPVSVSLGANEKTSKSVVGTQLARVAGMVIDEQKRPVAGARVASQTVSRSGDFMIPMMMPGGGAADGISAPDGSVLVRPNPDTDVQIAAAKKGYPSAKSSTLRLAPGERKSGVVLTIPSGMLVTGHVIDKNGKPLSGVSVVAAEAGGGPFNNAIRMAVMGGRRDRGDETIKSGNDGSFQMRVKEGTYDLAFKLDGYAAKSLRAVRVTSAMKPVEITLEPGVEIAGRVTRGGAGVEGVRINLISENVQTGAETGPDGSFRIADLSPGTMMLNAMKEDEFIQQVRQVTAPDADVNIEIPPGGRISGRVVDKSTKQPVASFQAGISTPRGGGGMVIMLPPALRNFTTEDGTFVLENVPAGQTQVVVNAPGYTSSRIPNVNVEEGREIRDLEVEMDRGVRLYGRVTGPDGAPVAGAGVRMDTMNRRVMTAGPMQATSTVTDANGDYSIEALEAGEKTFVFSRSGYLTEQKSATLSGTETRLDVQMSNGIRVGGTVMTDSGAPVGEARVFASAAAGGGFGGSSTVTDSNGNFTFEGLAPGRYRFTANKQGLASGEVLDFNVAPGAQVRITMKSGGVIYGHVSGLSPDELQQTSVSASGQGSNAASAVDSSGNFRIEGTPTGTVRVTARMGMGFGGGKTSPMQSVQVDPGASVQVDITFKSDTVIRGRVTRNGQAVEGAVISFNPKAAQAQTNARTTSGRDGQYEISGLDDAAYNVSVMDIQRSAPFITTYEVRGSGNFDIDMKSAPLRGRVVDTSGNPVSEALVEIREKSSTSEFRMGLRTVQTDAAGGFLMENVPPGTYALTAEKEGYGTKAVETVVNDSGGNVEITLSPNAGVVLRVVDARDGRLLNARVRVTDARGAGVYDSPMFMSAAPEPVKLPLEPGTYRATITVMGYAPLTMTITSPSSPTAGMTPGGTILVQSKGSDLRRARLLAADGKPYASFGPGIFMVDPSPGVTTLRNIAPGTYTLQILGSDGNEVTASTTVTVVEGQQATVQI